MMKFAADVVLSIAMYVIVYGTSYIVGFLLVRAFMPRHILDDVARADTSTMQIR